MTTPLLLPSHFFKYISSNYDRVSQGEELTYRGKVNPLNSSVRDKPDQVSGLVFPDFVAKKFLRSREIHYEVLIEKKSSSKSVKQVNKIVATVHTSRHVICVLVS